MSTARQYCTFHLDRFLFGVELEKVQEVIRYQEMTRVPLAPPEVTGLINLRGQIVTAVDTRRQLGLEQRSDDQWPMNVVVRAEEGAVSLLVDEIGDVVEVGEELVEEVPPTLQGPVRKLIRSACKLKERLLLVLDIERCCRIGAANARTEDERKSFGGDRTHRVESS